MYSPRPGVNHGRGEYTIPREPLPVFLITTEGHRLLYTKKNIRIGYIISSTHFRNFTFVNFLVVILFISNFVIAGFRI